MERFTGSVEPIAPVEVRGLIAWISAIDLRLWPQQTLAELKPAMVTDPNWFGFGVQAKLVINQVWKLFPSCSPHEPMLSCVMPGHSIPPHVDHQAPYWLCRVHVPLTSNDKSKFIVDGEHYHLEVGQAYRVNTEAEHSVENDGLAPRIHFMFDVRTNA